MYTFQKEKKKDASDTDHLNSTYTKNSIISLLSITALEKILLNISGQVSFNPAGFGMEYFIGKILYLLSVNSYFGIKETQVYTRDMNLSFSSFALSRQTRHPAMSSATFAVLSARFFGYSEFILLKII